MVLVPMFSITATVGASPVMGCGPDFAAHTTPSLVYDGTPSSGFDYDSGTALVTNEKENATAETVVPFANFAGFFAAKSGTQLARELGVAGEEMSGIAGPKTRIPSLTGTASYRVPNELIPNVLLRDAKNVGELRVTPQLIDFGQYSQQNNLRFILDVRQNTVMGPSAQQFIDQYGVQINRIYPAR